MKQTLKAHVPIHTGEEEITCGTCAQTSVHKSNLKRHMPILITLVKRHLVVMFVENYLIRNIVKNICLFALEINHTVLNFAENHLHRKII